MDYEKDIEIDESALDVEWLNQASLMWKYGRHAAHARMEVDKAKEALDIKRAELDGLIRLEPQQYNIEKITEAVVTNTIALQPGFQKVNEKYIEAKYESDMAQAAVRAIDQRKTALENLVRLHGQQYFAGPSVPRDLSKEWAEKEKQKQSNEEIGGAIKRKGAKK